MGVRGEEYGVRENLYNINVQIWRDVSTRWIAVELTCVGRYRAGSPHDSHQKPRSSREDQKAIHCFRPLQVGPDGKNVPFPRRLRQKRKGCLWTPQLGDFG